MSNTITVEAAVAAVVSEAAVLDTLIEVFEAETVLAAAVGKAAWVLDTVFGVRGVRCVDNYEVVKAVFAVAS
jgi:hypothetical protein